MKVINIFLLILVSLHSFGQKSVEYTFDFTDTRNLMISPNISDEDLKNKYLYITNRTISSSDGVLKLSFSSTGSGVNINNNMDESGTIFSSSLSVSNQSRLYFNLQDSRAYITEIRFNDINSMVGGMYAVDENNMEKFTSGGITYWQNKAGSKPNTVEFFNSGMASLIYQIKVSYVIPTDILVPKSSISNNSTIDKFESLSLTFQKVVSKNGNPNITIFDGVNTSKLSITVKDNVVNLFPISTIIDNGTYKVTIPAKSFVSQDGFENPELVYEFKVKAPQNTLNYVSVNPEVGIVREIPNGIKLRFNEQVMLPDNPVNIPVYKEGKLYKYMKPVVDPDNNKCVILNYINNVTDPITVEADYTIAIPEGSIYDNMKGTDAEHWNPEITLEYTVKGDPKSAAFLAAEELIKYEGLGYPSANSESRTELARLLAMSPTRPSDDEINAAVLAFYNEKDVTLPTSGKYYLIAAISKDRETLRYLSYDYDSDNVSLTNEVASAAAFYVEKSGDGISFKTLGDSYLTTLIPQTSNTTYSYDQILSPLKVEKFVAPDDNYNKECFGLFRISGKTGKESPASLVSSVRLSDNSIISDENKVLFSSDETSAFVFIETTQPSFSIPTTELKSTLSPTSMTEGELTDITIAFEGVESLSLIDATAAYISKSDSKVANVELKPVEGTFNKFSVTLPSSLTSSTYNLVIPTGTLQCKLEGKVKPYLVEETKKSFVIEEPEDIHGSGADGGFITNIAGIFVYNRPDYPVKDEFLNNIVLYREDIPIYPDPKMNITISYWNNGDYICSGHLEPCTIADMPDVFAIKLVLQNPIRQGSLLRGVYDIALPEGSFGDANFAQYLEDKYSIEKSKCRVNVATNLYINVDNSYISGINNIEMDDNINGKIYDVLGRKVNKMQKGNMYIVNGKKFIKE